MVNTKENKSSGERPGFETWASHLSWWDALFKSTAMPETFGTIFKSLDPSFESLMKIMETLWQKIHMSMEDFHKMDSSIYSSLDKDALGKWSEIYDKEFRKFLNIPQLGLNRFHQEKISDSLDKFMLLQNAMAEFLQILCGPLEKSGRDMQIKVRSLAENDELPEEPRDYYNIWIKILEKNYMTLFKTEEYLTSLAKTMGAMGEYTRAKKLVIDGLLQTFYIPTTRDMDDMYEEMYFLKKRVKKIEKALNSKDEVIHGGE